MASSPVLPVNSPEVAQLVEPCRRTLQLGGRGFFFKQKHDDRVGFDAVEGLGYESGLHY